MSHGIQGEKKVTNKKKRRPSPNWSKIYVNVQHWWNFWRIL